ncbi:MAG: transcription termination factor Rho, partial [Planctomycetota bacterium]
MTATRDSKTAASTDELARCSGAELLAALAAEGSPPTPGLGRGELVAALVGARLQRGQAVTGDGVLELLPEGFGFLRCPALDYAASPHDPFVSPSQVRSVNLQPGHRVTGPLRAPKGNERFFALTHIDSVHGGPPAALAARPAFAA